MTLLQAGPGALSGLASYANALVPGLLFGLFWTALRWLMLWQGSERPLALYYFGDEDADCARLLSGTTSGNVGINNTLMHVAQEDLPFGGVGASGMGAYHGVEGFRAMSHAKGVFVQGRWNLAGMLRAPFPMPVDAALRVMLSPKRGP